MPSGESSKFDFSALAAAIRGHVVLPGSTDYDELCSEVWNLKMQAKPSAIVLVVTTKDVQTTVKFIAENGLDFTVAGGRHTLRCFKDNAVAIDLRRLSNVFIDCEKSIAHVGGGALLYHLDLECEAHGNKFAVAGTNASTGIGGFTIGGGWGYLSRKHGMAVDNLVEAEVVTAGGKLHVVNDKNEPDLFWAIKGAGHNYGVCTKFVFKLHEVNTAFSGLIIRPFSAAAHVLKSYVNHYYGSKPADLEDVSSVVLAYGPPGPDDVQHQVAMTFCIWVGKGTEADARTALADLLEDTEGPVLANTVASIPYATGLQMMLEPIQAPGLWIEKAMFIEGRLPESVQEVLIESFAKAPTKGCSIVVHPIGGKIGELPSDATAFPHRIKSGSWVIMVGRADNEADYQKLENWMKEEYPKLEPFKAGVFVNEIGSWWNESAQADDSAVKELVASKKDYWGGNLDRLQKLKEKYDPGNLFKNHSKSLMSKN